MNRFFLLSALAFVMFFFSGRAPSDWRLQSPDGKIQIVIENDTTLRYRVLYNDTLLIHPSAVALDLGRLVLGKHTPVVKAERKTIDETIIPAVAQKQSLVRNKANEITLYFKGGHGIVFRAYNEGIAWRFHTAMKDSVFVRNETATVACSEKDSVWFPCMTDWPRDDRLNTSFEVVYRLYAAKDILPDSVGPAPALVVKSNGIKIGIAESDVTDYPGMFISGVSGRKGVLKGVFPAYPAQTVVEGDLYQVRAVVKRHPWIARTAGTRAFPWRVLIIAPDDGVLLSNDLVWSLASPQKIRETDWIRPGKAMDNWIIDGILYGVDFLSGNNTESYKYYIDFASRYGVEYIMIEPEWNAMRDILTPIPAMNMPELFAYAREKHVGLWLWTEALALSRNREAVLDSFRRWGAAGLMVDFFNRNDQLTVNELEEIAASAAKRKLILMFHGVFPSSGFERTWPNVLTREAVLGSEYNKWSSWPTPEHNLAIAFIRGLSGPFDYEPLVLPNATRESYRVVGSHPMAMGTRCAELAKYIVYASPFQVIAGSPVDLAKDDACIRLIANIPTTWDETVVPAARVNEYAVVARRKGTDWYLGGMNNSRARTLSIDLSFLGEGNYTARIFQDGANAHRHAGDYKVITQTVTCRHTLEIPFAPGGGYVAEFRKN